MNTSQKWLNLKCQTKSNKWLKDSLEKFIKNKSPLKRPFNTWADWKTLKNLKIKNYLPAWLLLCTPNLDSMPVTLRLNLWSQLTYLLESSIKTLSKRSFSKFFFKFYKTILKSKIKSTYLPKWSSNKLGEGWQNNLNFVKSYLKIITFCQKILKWFNLWFVLLTHQ